MRQERIFGFEKFTSQRRRVVTIVTPAKNSFLATLASRFGGLAADPERRRCDASFAGAVRRGVSPRDRGRRSRALLKGASHPRRFGEAIGNSGAYCLHGGKLMASSAGESWEGAPSLCRRSKRGSSAHGSHREVLMVRSERNLVTAFCLVSLALPACIWTESFQLAETNDAGSDVVATVAEETEDGSAPASSSTTLPGAFTSPSSGAREPTSPASGTGASTPTAGGDSPATMSCPPECTGGCSATTCRILCDDAQECKEQSLLCPSGWACLVECRGQQSCERAVLECGAATACSATCTGQQSCRELLLLCGATDCGVSCGGPDSCEETNAVCGTGRCYASCSEQAETLPALENCAAAQSCEPC